MTPPSAGDDAGFAWWARGLLLENCNCQVVCPGHVHFDQLCTHPRCTGYWAIRFEQGEFGGTALGGLRAVIVYDSPRHMIDGDWTEGIIVDRAASEAQRRAVEAIVKGMAGGPWEKLARFVGRWLPTRVVPIRIQESAGAKAVEIDGLLQSTLEPIRGRDRAQPVTFENMFNQIHAPSQVIARGSTRYDDGEIMIATDKTHGLWSRFEWAVTGH
jgi:hypothetical protein